MLSISKECEVRKLLNDGHKIPDIVRESGVSWHAVMRIRTCLSTMLRLGSSVTQEVANRISKGQSASTIAALLCIRMDEVHDVRRFYFLSRSKNNTKSGPGLCESCRSELQGSVGFPHGVVTTPWRKWELDKSAVVSLVQVASDVISMSNLVSSPLVSSLAARASRLLSHILGEENAKKETVNRVSDKYFKRTRPCGEVDREDIPE